MKRVSLFYFNFNNIEGGFTHGLNERLHNLIFLTDSESNNIDLNFVNIGG
jgi:hypothetical protein